MSSSVRSFSRRAACRNQISPSGKIVGPGNAEETPLWVMGVWEHIAGRGIAIFSRRRTPPGMGEREDMGAEKLDSVTHVRGPAPLQITYRASSGQEITSTLEPGKTFETMTK